MGNRTPKLPSALVSVAAGVNKTDGEALLPSTVPTIPDVPESSEPGVPQSRFEGPSALLNEMDQNDSDTPLNPEMGKDDIEVSIYTAFRQSPLWTLTTIIFFTSDDGANLQQQSSPRSAEKQLDAQLSAQQWREGWISGAEGFDTAD